MLWSRDASQQGGQIGWGTTTINSSARAPRYDEVLYSFYAVGMLKIINLIE